MNNYARLSHVKGDIAGLGTAVNSTLDPAYLRGIESSSREVDGDIGRHLYLLTSTRYYGGDGGDVLSLPHDVVSVSSVTVDEDGDGTYELTLVEGIDFWLAPYAAADEGRPYWQIELNRNGVQLGHWPRFPRAIKIEGVFGFSERLESVGTLGAELASGATSATMADGHTVEAGDMLKIGSESIYVSAVSSNTLTVSRAQNGTTAATHAIAAAVSVYRFPPAIEEAVRLRVAHQRWENSSGIPMGEQTWRGGSDYAKYRGLLAPFRRMVVA